MVISDPSNSTTLRKGEARGTYLIVSAMEDRDGISHPTREDGFMANHNRQRPYFP